jgi:type IV fimbrial biogenesis protein FimT
MTTRLSRAAARGYTLIEILMALAVLVILTGIAIPSFREMFLAQAVRTAGFDVFSGLLLARSEAVTRNTTVSVVPSAGNWSEGWTIADADGEVVERQDRMPRVMITGPGRVTYNGAGRVSTGATSFSLTANGGRAAHASCISIDLSGRPAQRPGKCL